MGCVSSEPESSKHVTLAPRHRNAGVDDLTEDDLITVQLKKLGLYINEYNVEMNKLSRTIQTCQEKAIKYKASNDRQLALHYIEKRKILEKQSSELNKRASLLMQKKAQIKSLRYDKQFATALAEANDLLERQLNNGLIEQLQRMNEINARIDADTEDLAHRQFAPEVLDDYEKLGRSDAVQVNMPILITDSQQITSRPEQRQVMYA